MSVLLAASALSDASLRIRNGSTPMALASASMSSVVKLVSPRIFLKNVDRLIPERRMSSWVVMPTSCLVDSIVLIVWSVNVSISFMPLIVANFGTFYNKCRFGLTDSPKYGTIVVCQK